MSSIEKSVSRFSRSAGLIRQGSQSGAERADMAGGLHTHVGREHLNWGKNEHLCPFIHEKPAQITLSMHKRRETREKERENAHLEQNFTGFERNNMKNNTFRLVLSFLAGSQSEEFEFVFEKSLKSDQKLMLSQISL